MQKIGLFYLALTPLLENKNGISTLSAGITNFEKPLELYYKIEEKHAEDLVTERADAFLLPLLPKAMMWVKKNKKPLTLICEAPVSFKLYHQLTNYYIPLLEKTIPYYAAVSIQAETAEEKLPCKNIVGTGISGGVDSSYTIAKYMNPAPGTYRLTHGIFFNTGIYDGYASKAEKLLEARAQKIAYSTGLEYLCMQTNTCKELYKKAYAPIVPFVFMGAALALQKLFSVFYYSSGFQATEFDFSETDAAHFDWLNTSCFATQNTIFYSSGMEVKRIEKVDFIKDYPFTYDNLSVCLQEEQSNGNCGRCAKCTRTMAELEALGALDRYTHVFDVKAFRKDPAYHWGYILLKYRTDPFCHEILKRYKASGKRLPVKAWLGAAKKYISRGFTTTNKKRERVEK